MIEYKDKMDFRACIHMGCDLFDITFYHDYAMILYAQAKLETGGFVSNIYKKGNNLFGMKPSIKRNRFWQSKLLGHAKYSHRFVCIMDRIDWDIWSGILFKGNVLDYMNAVVKKGYAEDKEYFSKWLKIYNEL